MTDGSRSTPDTAALFSAIVQSTDDAILSTDTAGIITSWNPAAEQLYGFTESEAIGQPDRLIVPPDRLAEEADVNRRVLEGQFVASFETVRIRKDGTPFDVSLTASPIRQHDGRILGISKICRDITVRKRDERAREEMLIASRQLATIVESSDDAIVAKDLQGTIQSWNPAAERMFGYTAEEAVGRSIRIIVPDDRQDEETTVLEKLARGEKIDHYQTIRLRKDGRRIPISLTVSPIFDDRGQAVGASKIARDITQLMRAEKARAREHRRIVFLARVAEALSTSLDYENTLKSIVGLAVPAIADWSAVDVVQEDGAIVQLTAAHVDSGKNELANRLRSYEDPSAPYSPAHVIRTGRPALVSEVTDKIILAAAQGDPERVRLINAFGPVSYLCVPLVSRGSAIGALMLGTGESGRRYTHDDLRFAEDLAARIAMSIQNARSYQQMQQANRLKDEFLGTLSHELRTPLNAILGYARIARSGIVTGDKLPRALETIERNAQALTQMVEDILDVSRIVAGKLRLNVQPVELPVVVHEAIDTVMPAADAKQIRIRSIVDPHVGPISGDPDRLRQVVWNLLANAIKFTPKEGQVQVRLERINSSVEITISDNGAGIAAEFLPHIFERFRQADASSSRQQAGLGLGLAIVRNLVELHGGTVSASSGGPGTGSTFRVRLPVMIVHPASPVEEERVHPRHDRVAALDRLPAVHRTHVLAVDDEPDSLRLLTDILESAGARVTTAGSAAAALEIIRTVRPDVLLADLGMPVMDGYELIKRLRQSSDREVRELPAAALTAYGRSEDRSRTLQAGFQMHLVKPVDPVELLSAVRALTRHNTDDDSGNSPA